MPQCFRMERNGVGQIDIEFSEYLPGFFIFNEIVEPGVLEPTEATGIGAPQKITVGICDQALREGRCRGCVVRVGSGRKQGSRVADGRPATGRRVLCIGSQGPTAVTNTKLGSFVVLCGDGKMAPGKQAPVDLPKESQ